MLVRWLAEHPEVVRGRRVLDFGTGGGLVAIAAALLGAAEVHAVDIDPLAATACAINAAANGVTGTVTVACEDIVDRPVDADVLLAGDVWYEADAAPRFAKWLRSVAATGVRVLTGDPGRAYVPPEAHELARYAIPTSVELESATSREARVLELLPSGP